MINEFDTDSITLKARIALLLTCTEKIMDRFADYPHTMEVVKKIISDSWSWLKTRTPDSGKNYQENNPALIEEEQKYQGNPLLLKAIHAVMYMQYYTINKMYVIEFYETGSTNTEVGNDIMEVDEDCFFDCLDTCIEAAKDPVEMEQWITSSIQKLQLEYAPANEEDLGADIGDKDFLSAVGK